MEDLRTYKAVRTSENLACAEGSTTHVILRGESLASIAAHYALSLNELLAANPHINPYAYRAGTVLCIPPVTAMNCCEGRLYCVKPNDTVSGIASAYGVTQAELVEANPILTQAGLIAGQILCVPVSVQQTPCPGAVEQILLTQGTAFVDILLAYNISFSALESVNPGVDLNELAIGQTLCIPARGSRGVPVTCAAAYTMQAGDTLESVAEALDVSVGALMMMNPMLLSGDFTEGVMICVA